MKFLTGLCISFFLFCNVATVPANTTMGADDALFWLDKLDYPDIVMMDAATIARYNADMVAKLSGTLYNLPGYARVLSKQELRGFLRQSEFPIGYSGGQKMTLSYRKSIVNQVNLAAVKEKNPVRPGIAVRRASLRLYPLAQGIFEEQDDKTFDVLQETILNPGEAVAILHSSADNNWLFVQSSNYRGWVPTGDIAETSYEKWLEWQCPQAFLVVTAAKLYLQVKSERVVLEMGAHMPVQKKESNEYIIIMPCRSQNGQAEFVEVHVPDDGKVHLGNLAYTQANCIKLAFNFLGEPYGWGGLKDSVDCSSFIMDIYRCFGFLMPRDADTQEVSVGKTYTVRLSNIKAVLAKTAPGATLHMNGHVMLYLGMLNGRYYVIHSSASQGMKVSVTDVEKARLHNGKAFITGIRIIKEWIY